MSPAHAIDSFCSCLIVLQRNRGRRIPHLLEGVPSFGLRCGLKPPIVDFVLDARRIAALLCGTLHISDSVLVREWRIVGSIVQ